LSRWVRLPHRKPSGVETYNQNTSWVELGCTVVLKPGAAYPMSNQAIGALRYSPYQFENAYEERAEPWQSAESRLGARLDLSPLVCGR
jgi:hypothetical protein